MSLSGIRELVAATPFFDTHEHLLEERTRLAGPGAHRLQPCVDAALLFYHYAGDDLWVAGMPAAERDRFFSPNVDPADKWSIVAPYWQRAQHTGYLRAVTETIRCVYEVEKVDASTFLAITERKRQTARLRRLTVQRLEDRRLLDADPMITYDNSIAADDSAYQAVAGPAEQTESSTVQSKATRQ